MRTVGEGEKGMGRKGGQYIANQGSEWTGIRATTQRRDFQVSKGRVPRNKGRDFQATKGDYQKDWGMHLRVYIMLILYISCK
jgi:hypothetical protein